MTVNAQCIVECFQPLNDRLAIGIRQMSHAAAVAQFALRNIGKLLGQGVEPADQLPYLIGRGRNINARGRLGYLRAVVHWQRCLCGDEPLLAQLVPELGGERLLQRDAT